MNVEYHWLLHAYVDLTHDGHSLSSWEGRACVASAQLTESSCVVAFYLNEDSTDREASSHVPQNQLVLLSHCHSMYLLLYAAVLDPVREWSVECSLLLWVEKWNCDKLQCGKHLCLVHHPRHLMNFHSRACTSPIDTYSTYHIAHHVGWMSAGGRHEQLLVTDACVLHCDMEYVDTNRMRLISVRPKGAA